jgi:hypothetical protein
MRRQIGSCLRGLSQAPWAPKNSWLLRLTDDWWVASRLRIEARSWSSWTSMCSANCKVKELELASSKSWKSLPKRRGSERSRSERAGTQPGFPGNRCPGGRPTATGSRTRRRTLGLDPSALVFERSGCERIFARNAIAFPSPRSSPRRAMRADYHGGLPSTSREVLKSSALSYPCQICQFHNTAISHKVQRMW